MTVNFPASAFETALANAASGMNEVARLRRAIFQDNHVSASDLKALFAFEERQQGFDRDWTDLFCDAVLHHMLEQEPPRGYVSDENARHLIELIGEKSHARTDTELEALTRLIEKAREVPPFFSAFVLRQIKHAAIYADGPDRQGRKFAPGCVGEVEIDFIRRVLWGAGSEGHLAVSLEEAEALFDIADATTGNDNHPAWNDFFARAVGNYLIGATGRQAPGREQSLQLWRTDHDASMAGFLGRMLASIARGEVPDFSNNVGGSTLLQDVEASAAEANVARERQTFDTAALTGHKADWLLDRVRRNGVTSGPEAALLDFIRRESTDIAPEVEHLLTEPKPGAGAKRPTFGRRS